MDNVQEISLIFVQKRSGIMRTRDELRDGCANLLRKLRLETGYSKSKMAETVGIDLRTWEKYESGQASPRVDEFIAWFDLFHADALRYVLDYLYPDIYDGLINDSRTDDLRKAAMHYISNVASDHAIKKFDFLVFGEHGSNIEAQTEEFTMLDHLPLTMRLAVASLIDILYQTAEANNLLVCTDCVMPVIDVFHDGLKKGREAVMNGKQSYTTSSVVKKI